MNKLLFLPCEINLVFFNILGSGLWCLLISVNGNLISSSWDEWLFFISDISLRLEQFIVIFELEERFPSSLSLSSSLYSNPAFWMISLNLNGSLDTPVSFALTHIILLLNWTLCLCSCSFDEEVFSSFASVRLTVEFFS